MSDVESGAARAAEERDEALRATPGRKRAHGVVATPPGLARFVVHAGAAALVRAGVTGGVDGGALVDPACGTGVFAAAALALGARPRVVVGIDVDEDAIRAAGDVLDVEARMRGVTLVLRHEDALASLALADELGDAPALVVGNPPWAARAASRGVAASDALVASLRPPGERRVGILSDAYVRFLAWSCALAERWRAPFAIALVTNASFLDGPVHALLRTKLAETFDSLDVVDLGGGALVARERGTRDEGLFGVRPPAAVTIGARAPGVAARRAEVRIATLRGSRAEKEAALAAGALAWAPVDDVRVAVAPRAARPRRWAEFTSVAELFPFHREGVQSNRDALVVDAERATLRARLEAFAAGAHDALAPLRRHWDPAAARRAIGDALRDGSLDASIVPIDYRPLDRRFACVHPAVCHRPRTELADAIAHGGGALVTARKDRGTAAWAHFGVATALVDNCWLSTRSSCRARAFPAHAPNGAPNVDARRWEDALGVALPFDVVAAWVLAVLAAPGYRRDAKAVLRHDYARIPAPPDAATLERVAAAGRTLAALFDAELPARDVDRVALDRPRIGVDRVELARGEALDAAPAGLALRIGHVDVVASFLRARRGAAVSRTTIAALCDRAARLAAQLDDLDDPRGPLAQLAPLLAD